MRSPGSSTKPPRRGGMHLVSEFVEFWEQLLAESDFTAGCPVVAAAIGSADEEPQLTSVAGSIFGHWRDALTRAFVSDGFDEPDAASLAIMCIAVAGGRRRAVPVDPQRRPSARCRLPDRIPDQVKGIRPAARSADRQRRPLGLTPAGTDEVAVDGRLRQRPLRARRAAPPARSERARRVGHDHLVDEPAAANCAATSPPPTTQTSCSGRRRTSRGCSSVTSPANACTGCPSATMCGPVREHPGRLLVHPLARLVLQHPLVGRRPITSAPTVS